MKTIEARGVIAFILLLLSFSANTCYADYELVLTDGITLTWQNYAIEGDNYCTNKSFGKFCILKKEVLSLKELPAEASSRSPVNTGSVSAGVSATETVRRAGAPVTGSKTPGVERLDEVMLKYMEKTGASAASLAIAEQGVMVLSRGYGWSDKGKTVPMQPNTMIGIASCEKPITAAAIRRLAREGRLSLLDSPFGLLKIKAQGTVVDERVRHITISHLLEHKAGWGADPVSEAAEAARKKGFRDPIPVEARAWNPDSSGSTTGFKNPIPIETLLGFIMTQRFKNEPGEKSEYCNFGYDTLRHVITKVTGRPYIEYFQRELFKPGVVREFKAHDLPRKKDDPPLVWNAETGGLSASAPALLRFMRSYWLTGEPRDSGNPLWVMYGSLPGSTAIMVWRPDGTDIAALFNSRASATHDEIRAELERVVESLK